MATPTETSGIEGQLRALVRLQYYDSRIDQLRKLQGDLPEEIRDLEDERQGLQTRIENARRDEREGEARRRKLLLDVGEAEGLIKRYEEQQLTVRNNREYDALTKEIEAQRQRIAAANEETEAMTAREGENTGAVEGAQVRLGELDELLKGKRAELETVVADTASEQEALAGRRAQAAEAIDARGAAAGFAVPPQRQVEIRQRDRIIASEHDGRIIVDDQLYREATEELDEA